MTLSENENSVPQLSGRFGVIPVAAHAFHDKDSTPPYFLLTLKISSRVAGFRTGTQYSLTPGTAYCACFSQRCLSRRAGANITLQFVSVAT